MIRQIIKKLNSEIDFKNLEDNHLSIQLSLDGFSFCIYHKIHKELGYFTSYFFDDDNISPYKHLDLIEEVYNKEPLLQLKFNSVSVCHFNNLACQVPMSLFDKNSLPQYLQYSVKVLENDYITYDELKNEDIVNVYIPFVNINNFLLDTYGKFEFKHSSTILIENLLNKYKNKPETYLFVNVFDHKFELVVIKNKKFTLFNCFEFSTKEDFIYYILFTAEQLKLNPETFNLILMGAIEKDSELYRILYRFVRNITFYQSKDFPSLLKGKVSQHDYFSLLNQYEV